MAAETHAPCVGLEEFQDDVDSIFDVEEELFFTRLSVPVSLLVKSAKCKSKELADNVGPSIHPQPLTTGSRCGRRKRPPTPPIHEVPSETQSMSTVLSDVAFERSLAVLMASAPGLVAQRLRPQSRDKASPDLDVEMIIKELNELEYEDVDFEDKFEEIVEQFPEFGQNHVSHVGEPYDVGWVNEKRAGNTEQILPWLQTLDLDPWPRSICPSPRGSYSGSSMPSKNASAMSHTGPDNISVGTGDAEFGIGKQELEQSQSSLIKQSNFKSHQNDQSAVASLDPITTVDSWEDSSQFSSSDWFSGDNISSIGTFAAEKLIGSDFEDILPWPQLREVVQTFISDIAAIKFKVDTASLQPTSLSDGTDGSGDISLPAASSSGGSSKRKLGASLSSGLSGRGDQNDDERKSESGGDNERSGSTKAIDAGRGRLEFMCPFRLKDPLRFNVRDWHDCCTKAYIYSDSCYPKRNDLNELR
jgi:hypothetical protein